MRVFQIPNEPTRYKVEATSRECIDRDCGKRVTDPKAIVCPACGGDLDVIFHVVDIASFFPVGECNCEQFTYRIRKHVSRLSALQLRGLGMSAIKELRCRHIEAAREHALNITLSQHAKNSEREKMYA